MNVNKALFLNTREYIPYSAFKKMELDKKVIVFFLKSMEKLINQSSIRGG